VQIQAKKPYLLRLRFRIPLKIELLWQMVPIEEENQIETADLPGWNSIPAEISHSEFVFLSLHVLFSADERFVMERTAH